jgi:hypothetical protein
MLSPTSACLTASLGDNRSIVGVTISSMTGAPLARNTGFGIGIDVSMIRRGAGAGATVGAGDDDDDDGAGAALSSSVRTGDLAGTATGARCTVSLASVTPRSIF